VHGYVISVGKPQPEDPLTRLRQLTDW